MQGSGLHALAGASLTAVSDSTRPLLLSRSLNVGVTGHRFNRLDGKEAARLTHEMRRVLATLSEAIAEIVGKAPDAKTLRIISPLAEGADRIAAALATEMGAALIALLPFKREAYADDFASAQSRADYRRLLSQATEIVELDGQRTSEAGKKAAYEKIGALVVERSDLLIAIWDGREARGVGGTAHVIDLARREGRPVLWLPTTDATRASAEPVPHLLHDDEVTDSSATEAFAAIAKRLMTRQP